MNLALRSLLTSSLIAVYHLGWVKPSAFLDNRLVSKIDVDPMDNNCCINSGHVLMGPGEYIFVFFKEADELVSKASKQLRSYLDRVLWVLVIQHDRL